MATGFTFGGKPATPAFGQTGFGAQPGGSITFGTPAVQQNPTPFGVAPTQPSTGFGTTGFGMPAFGTPASTTQTTGLAFGAPVTGTPGFSVGGTPASSAPSTGLTFGTPATSAPVNSFGFGTPASTGLTFGTPATSASTGFPFGSTAPVATTGLTFGTPVATTSAPSFGFGTPATQPTLNLGQQPTSLAPSLFSSSFPFGAPTATTTSAPSLNFGFGATPITTASTFNLNNPITTTTTGLNFGLGTTTQSGGLSFGLGGTSTSLTLSKPTTVTTAQSSFGLGGIVQSTPKSGSTTTGKPEILPKDQQLPNELLQTVENYKNVIKQQKNYSSDVSRSSSKVFTKVATTIDQVGSSLNEIEKKLQNNRVLAEKLKLDTTSGLQHVEMAQRTMDTPPGLQYENIMPVVYFKELVDNFEKEMQNLKTQIEYTDKYIRNFDKAVPLNSQDLALGMRKLHETFVALAGRLQAVHNQVKSQKEQYLNFRKYMLNDDTNIFESRKNTCDILAIPLNTFNYKPPAIASGPSPFSSLSHPSVIQAAVQNQIQTTTGNVGFGAPVQSTTSNLSLFGNTNAAFTNFGQSSGLSATNTGFQLQKPPSGNKRGKQITY